ncbi:MAG: nodulation protein NfeD [Clostridia bacterium]|nr:nodulation protein NfeD [Clostridia bacterium]
MGASFLSFVKSKGKVALWAVVLLLFLPFFLYAATQKVWVVPVQGTIDRVTEVYLERVYDEAGKKGVDRVILEIDTPGGLIYSASEIRNIIKNSSVPTTAFVKGGALSAGALIALSAENIYMAPGTIVGGAEPRYGGERADEKVVSHWASLLAAAAEERGRDGKIARAMADRDIEVPGLKEKGKLLTLTHGEALKVGYAEGQAKNPHEVVEALGLKGAAVEYKSMKNSEKLARFITNPYVAPFLLAAGFLCLVVELITVGFGIAGVLSLSAFLLYFWGHIFAGISGMLPVILFVAGVFLILLELTVIPGFGIAGIGGMAFLFVGIIFSTGSLKQGIVTIILALLGTGAAVYFSFKYGKTRKMWQRLVLDEKLDTESGYISSRSTLKEYIGKRGISLTPLRPAGTVLIDGKRVDVVTEGGYIDKGASVEVVEVEGNRVVVREIIK